VAVRPPPGPPDRLLADLAVHDLDAFGALAEEAKASLPQS